MRGCCLVRTYCHGGLTPDKTLSNTIIFKLKEPCQIVIPLSILWNNHILHHANRFYWYCALNASDYNLAALLYSTVIKRILP